MQTIAGKVKAADLIKVAAVKARILAFCDGADRAAGPAMPNWQAAANIWTPSPNYSWTAIKFRTN